MSIIVTLDMYSGRQNPSWELSEADAKKFMKMMSKRKEISTTTSPGSLGRLGYRGLVVTHATTPVASGTMQFRVFDGIVEPASLAVPNLIDNDSEVEAFLIDAAGTALSSDEIGFIKGEVEKNVKGGVANSFLQFEMLAAPPFDPTKWNSSDAIRLHNNCYNYANDKITNTFAQPGKGSGQEGPYPPTCPGTGQAAVRDGQIVVKNPDVSPAEGQIIALVVSSTPGFFDYHWYRRDSNGMWSHKPGQTPAKNTDNSGRTISNPETCDRGPYNLFCGYFNSIPSKTTIR
ncbi:hypothetical protein [Pseudomonas sp. A34-9]|uniref:hypothetical protein n=1 Tax=Pseudomonas sp. A34-9 TaxID=3034675 RepID=UPI00240CE6B4|nr:hypothetical protein [Pseudomonas sp. A34-9]